MCHSSWAACDFNQQVFGNSNSFVNLNSECIRNWKTRPKPQDCDHNQKFCFYKTRLKPHVTLFVYFFLMFWKQQLSEYNEKDDHPHHQRVGPPHVSGEVTLKVSPSENYKLGESPKRLQLIKFWINFPNHHHHHHQLYHSASQKSWINHIQNYYSKSVTFLYFIRC